MDNVPVSLTYSPVKVPQPSDSNGFGYGYGSNIEGPKQNRLHDYWHILLKRKGLILVVFLIVFFTVALSVYLAVPIYKATATLQIVQDNTSAMIGGERDPYASKSAQDNQARFYETQYMLFRSRSFAQKIMQSLNLQERPEYISLDKKLRKENKTPEEITSAFTDQFLDSLNINALKNSYLVEFSYESPDRYLTKQVANAVYQEYVKFCMNTRQQSYALIKDWLQNELSKLGSKVEASERKLYDYSRGKNFIAFKESKDDVVTNRYVELSNLLTLAQVDRSKKEAQYSQLSKNKDTSLITNNELIQRIRQDVIAVEAKVSSISQQYDINYPGLQTEKAKLHQLRSRLNNEIRRVRESVTADYNMALKAENLLREELEDQKKKVADLQDNLVEQHIMQRDMHANEQLYQALLARMKEVSVSSTMVASNVAVISPAELPLVPFKPKKSLNLLLGGIIGLLAATSLAFLTESLDKSIKTCEDLEKTCRVPLLGITPQLPGRKKEFRVRLGLITFKLPNSPISEAMHQILTSIGLAASGGAPRTIVTTSPNPNSPISEAVHQILTSIGLAASGGAPRTIVITSPNPNEGKTTISINLASALAAFGGKVVLIDSDLRKPILHEFFQKPMKPGLTNFLTGSASLTEIIQPTFIPDLYLISAGDIPPNPIVLLDSPAFDDLLKSLRDEFQHIILDSPPVIGFADGRIISLKTDGVLLVFRHQHTTIESGLLATQLLTQINCRILGGILNMVQKNGISNSGYADYYKNYSKYQKHYAAGGFLIR
jgi:succinoglycan biosynthesis transport protein ExoP